MDDFITPCYEQVDHFILKYFVNGFKFQNDEVNRNNKTNDSGVYIKVILMVLAKLLNIMASFKRLLR